jgi:hypothetical protein
MILGVIVVVVIVAAVVAVIAIAVWQRKSLRKNVRIELNNEGNIPTRYELRAEDPDGILAFEYNLDGDSLPAGRGPQAEATASPPAQAAEPAAPEEKAKRKWIIPSGPSDEAAEAKEKGKEAQEKAKEAHAKGKEAMGFTGAVAEMLFTLGMVLPRSLGRPLLDISSNMRRTKGRIETVESAPGRVSSTVGRVQKSAPQVKAPQAELPKGEFTAPEISMPEGSKPDTEAPTAPQAQPQATEQPAVSEARGLQLIGEGWVQTPFVEPGGKFRFDLLVKPLKPRKTQHYSFGLLSRPVDLDDTFAVHEEWTIQITGATGWRRFHPYLLIAALSVLALLLAFWLSSLGVLS